ncbi:MAG TPA: type II secretion system F family protein, partial [Pirellulaceae bacterium]|nr:type II secretion system F family protein [Pirellulaceae bacterium]
MDEQQPTTEKTPTLTATAAEAVVERAAHIVALGMPLPAGLRAAAKEADSWQLARALNRIAGELDAGRSLSDCLTQGDGRWPQPLSGLVHAAERVGEVGPMLGQWIENRLSARRHWRGVLAALAYPALSIVLFVLVFVEFNAIVIGPFKELIQDIGLKLPMNTRAIFWISGVGVRILAVLAAVIAVALIVVRLMGGRVAWSALMNNLPLVGPAWHWTGVVEMLRCLGLLVEYRVPLPEALRLAAGGIADAHVAKQCRALATRVEQGTSLTMAIVGLRTLPLSIAPLVRWGEQHDCLGDALRWAAEMLEGRLRLRTGLLVQVIPPVVFVLIGVMAI